MGAPDVPEPLTLGVQYLTRYNTWKDFVRATGQALACASREPNIRVKLSSSSVVPHLKNSNGQKPSGRKVQPLPWGDIYDPCNIYVAKHEEQCRGSCNEW